MGKASWVWKCDMEVSVGQCFRWLGGLDIVGIGIGPDIAGQWLLLEGAADQG